MKWIGVVCGALVALFAASNWIAKGVSDTWMVATRPLLTELHLERLARQQSDSLMLRELRDTGRDVDRLGKAMKEPWGSAARDRVLNDIPGDQREKKRK